jgi:hypothetical protein
MRNDLRVLCEGKTSKNLLSWRLGKRKKAYAKRTMISEPRGTRSERTRQGCLKSRSARPRPATPYRCAGHIEPRGLRVRVRRHLLGVLQLRLGVFVVGGDAGAPEGVIADAVRLDPGLCGSALDHAPGAVPVKAARTKGPGLAVRGAEEGAVPVLADPGRLDVFPQPVLEVVLAGHLVMLAAFLVQPHPERLLLGVVSRNRRKFRQPKSSPAMIASRSMIWPVLRKVG